MPDPYLASNEFPGDGVTTLYNISFKGNRPDAGSGVVPYLSSADVKAQVITPATSSTAEIVEDVPCVFVGPNQFSVTPATPVGKITRIYRATQDEYALVDYQALQTVGEADLDLSNRQVVFVVQEAHDLAVRAKAAADHSSDIAYDAVTIANDAAATATGAESASNTAVSTAQSALTVAQTAETNAAAALVAAASAEDHATSADNAALAAQADAANALVVAGTANTNAATALATANGIAGTANTALANSITANDTANDALDVANGIAGTANTALTNANAAVTTANTANATANDALDVANGIEATANDALAVANAAQADADALATSKQNVNGNLTALSGLSGVADRLAYFTAAAMMSLTTFTAFARSLLAAATAADARTTLQVSDGWATQPIGVPIPIFSNLVGTASPPTANGYTYIKLTAGDAYNSGLLTSENTTGSAPLVISTAVINVAGSPINGQTVSLINTERRFLRGGSAGVVEQDALQTHTHTMAIQSTDNTAGFNAFRLVANVQQTGNTGGVDAARTATETRSKNIGVTYFMRVL